MQFDLHPSALGKSAGVKHLLEGRNPSAKEQQTTNGKKLK
jgi:hypothetical protein